MDTGDGNDDGRASRSRRRLPRRPLLAGVGLAAATALGGCAATADRRTTTEAFSVPGASVDRLVVRGDDGRTVVGSHDGSDVRVSARTYAVGATDLSEVRVTREVTDGRLAVGVETPAVVGVGGGGLESLTVRVPRDVRVERVATDDGTARVTGVAGDPTVSVDDGAVEVDGLDGTVSVDVDDGDVTLGAVGGVRGRLDDGTLRMREAATVGDLAGDDADLDLAVDALDGDTTVRTDDGDVEAALSAALDARVVVRTDDGDVSVAAGALDGVETAGDVVRGTVGDATDRLTVEVDDGDVRLRPLALSPA